MYQLYLTFRFIIILPAPERKTALFHIGYAIPLTAGFEIGFWDRQIERSPIESLKAIFG